MAFFSLFSVVCLLEVSIRFKPMTLVNFSRLVRSLTYRLNEKGYLIRHRYFRYLLMKIFGVDVRSRLFQESLLRRRTRLRLKSVTSNGELQTPLTRMTKGFRRNVVQRLQSTTLIFRGSRVTIHVIVNGKAYRVRGGVTGDVRRVRIYFLLTTTLTSRLYLLSRILLATVRSRINAHMIKVRVLNTFLNVRVMLRMNVKRVLQRINRSFLGIFPYITPKEVKIILVVEDDRARLRSLFLRFQRAIRATLIMRINPPTGIIRAGMSQIRVIMFFRARRLYRKRRSNCQRVTSIRSLVIIMLTTNNLDRSHDEIKMVSGPYLKYMLTRVISRLRRTKSKARTMYRTTKTTNLLARGTGLRQSLLILLARFRTTLASLDGNGIGVNMNLFQIHNNRMSTLQVRLYSRQTTRNVSRLRAVQIGVMRRRLFRQRTIGVYGRTLSGTKNVTKTTTSGGGFGSFRF